MDRPVRTTVALVALIAAALTLSSCSLVDGLLNPGPPRGDDGKVTEATVTSSLNLLVGDCFTFTDATNYAEVEVAPCAESHTYVVIGQGELTAAEVSTAGSLQNAVSGACAEPFIDFKAAATAGVRPKQEFIVTQQEKDGEQLALYSCVATDS